MPSGCNSTNPSSGNGGSPAKNTTTKCTPAMNAEQKKRADEACKQSKAQQKAGDSCALMSTRSLMATAFPGKALPSESDMIKTGLASGAFRSPNGTGFGTVDARPILSKVGLPSHQTNPANVDQMAQSLDQGKGVVVFYDARPVWNQASPTPLGHAVRVSGVERDPQGNVTSVYTVDSGDGTCHKIPRATFDKALKGFNGGRTYTTDKPILPPI